MQVLKKIVVVDDEPDTTTFLCAWLEDQGYDSCFAADGKQGIILIRIVQPDLILLDLKMPNHTGIQLYREICLDEQLKNIPVIMITGMTDFDLNDTDCSLLPEPLARIDKPIDLNLLHSAINQAFA